MDWAAAIVDALENARMMLALFSQHFNESRQVDREIELAAEQDIPILTFRLSDAAFSGVKKYYLKNLHWIDAFPNPEQCFGSLKNNVCLLLNISSDETKTPIQLSTNLNFDDADASRSISLPRMEDHAVEQKNDGLYNKVDLGLSVCWADRNVGASTPEGYGDYFAWGETEPKSEYTKENYKYYDKDKEDYIYIGEGISDTEYDVARVKWGEGWRMPTGDEIEELRDKCQWVWCEKNGVNGRLITGPNGNSIFLPAAGASEGHWKNVKGRYWTGTKRFSGEADRICFGENSYMWMSWSNYCYWGCTIRPVMAKPILLQTDKSQENAPALSQQNHMGEYPKSLKFSYEGQEFYMVLSPDRTYYMGNIKAVGQDFSWLDSSWLQVGGGAAIAASAVALGILAWPMAIVLFLRAVSGWSNGKDKNNHTDCIKVNESLCNELSKSSGYKFAKPTEEELEGVTQEEKPFCVVLRVTDNPNLTLAQENS